MNAMYQHYSGRRSHVMAMERLKRLLSETSNLRRMLISYKHEPTTERSFNQRETLWERLNNLEGQCRQFLRKPLREGEETETTDRKDQELFAEYTRLEEETWDYLKKVRH